MPPAPPPDNNTGGARSALWPFSDPALGVIVIGGPFPSPGTVNLAGWLLVNTVRGHRRLRGFIGRGSAGSDLFEHVTDETEGGKGFLRSVSYEAAD
ncbi:MAG: hypothetical protein M1826_007067 [Phylliscum demangeonii]|nr:MAG: hypothetical protein M1826_007067 [Phylliscum demangeonii]